MDLKELTINWGTLWRALLVFALAAVLYLALDVVLALFLAVVISSGLDPIVSWLEKKRIPRILGTLAIYVVAIFLLALLVYLIVPIALAELNSLIANLSDRLADNPLGLNITEGLSVINETLSKITNALLSGGRSLVDISSKFLGGLALTASVFVLSFYLTVGKDGTERFLIAVVPAVYETKVIEIYDRVRRKIGRWLRGQLVLSAAVGTSVFLGLWFLGVKYSLILGIIAALAELIPYVGPIFSGSLAVIVAITTSWTLALYTLILFIIIQQLENHIFVPAVMSLTTSLNPVVILISLLIGSRVFGFIGLIIAVPVAVLAQEFIEDWSAVKKRNKGLGV